MIYYRNTMNSLFLLHENITFGSAYISLYIISSLSVLCGIFVIISKNPIISVWFLIGLFLSIASYLILLGMNFIGLSYLLVYVGAVSILFLFILMLINVRISELITDTNNSTFLAVLVCIIFYSTLYEVHPFDPTVFKGYNLHNTNSMFNILEFKTITNFLYAKRLNYNINPDNNDISYVVSLAWDNSLTQSSHIGTIGNVLYTTYPIWLIITSMVLLLAMVGTIVISIKRN